MLAAAKSGNYPVTLKLYPDTVAFCETSGLKPGHLAIIFFNKKELTHGVVSHELLHASCAYMCRKKRKDLVFTTEEAPDEEEDLCGVLDGLVDAFYKKFSI